MGGGARGPRTFALQTFSGHKNQRVRKCRCSCRLLTLTACELGDAALDAACLTTSLDSKLLAVPCYAATQAVVHHLGLRPEVFTEAQDSFAKAPN